MQTIAVLSRKGGSGKTTVALSLALAARDAGLKAVIADVDPQHSAGEVLRARSDAGQLLVETAAGKLFLLKDACAKSGCDLLIIDTPATPEADLVLAINMADLCVAVSRPSTLDIAAVQQTLALIRRIGRPGLVVLNQCPPARGNAESGLVARATEALTFGGLQVARARLRSCSAYQQAFEHHLGVTEWSPEGEAAREITKLFAEIGERLRLPLGLREPPAAEPARAPRLRLARTAAARPQPQDADPPIVLVGQTLTGAEPGFPA
jgi:chromosome partitioning protein